MSDEGGEEKPHSATPKKREDYRKQGKFARARDATAIASIGGVMLALIAGQDAMTDTVMTMAQRCFGDPGALARGEGPALLAAMGMSLLVLIAPAAIGAALVGSLVGTAQAGFRFYPELLAVKLDRLDPIPRLKQMFDLKHAGYELVISLVRVGLVGAVCWFSLRDQLPALVALAGAPLSAAAAQVAAILCRLTLTALAALAVMGAADWFKEYRKLEKEMRMSHKEIIDEMKQNDGNPKLKGKLRQRMREVSRRRGISSVKEADVVVTNPTHISVAIRYSETDAAPIVVAKGHDQVALRIRAEARKHGILIVENRRLARALDADVEVGQHIGQQHYLAVAEVLAFLYRLRADRGGKRGAKKGPTARRHQPSTR